MDFAIIRSSEGKDLARYYRNATSSLSTKQISQTLLHGIESGALPSRVFSIWLTASDDPAVVNEGLRQDFSHRTRLASIKRFGRWLRTSRAEAAFEALGDTVGALDFLSEASVSDVKLFCSRIQDSSTSRKSRDQRQRRIDELFKALNPQLFPGNGLKTIDERPLSTYYVNLLGACSPELAFEVWRDNLNKLDYHTSVLALSALSHTHRLQCLDIIARHTEGEGGERQLGALLDLDVEERADDRGERTTSNMDFAIEVLRRVSRDDKLLRLKYTTVHSTIIIPLFRGLRRKKSKAETIAEVVRLFVDYRWALLEKEKSLASIPDDSQILRTAIHRWSRHPEALQETLERLLNLHPFSHVPDEAKMVDLLRLVPRRLRYRLLRLLLLKTNSRSDIELDEHLKVLRFQWSPDVLHLLPRQTARGLLERLIRLQPSEMHGHWGRWRSGQLEVPRQHDGDPTCMMLLLSRGDADCGKMAQDALSDIKEKAQKARQQAARAVLVQRTLHYAIASGSLDLYRDTLLWTRKYIKDPVTCMEVYSGRNLSATEALDLLSGFLATGESSKATTNQVHHDVCLGNQICKDLVETACLALNEPSFQAHHWRCAINLLWNVVQRRINKIGRLQKSLSLDDKTLFDLVWQPTIDTIMKLESIGLDEANSQLAMNRPEGLLSSPLQITAEPAILQFLEKLSRLRDDLWQDYRAKHHPATITLPDQVPNGLAIQHLPRCKFDLEPNCYDMPFLRSRATEIVFADPEKSLSPLPEDAEVNEAVDVFIDHWPTALEAYIYTHPKSERYDKALQAWHHAIGPLSRSRMSENEAFAYWKPHFVAHNAALVSKAKRPWDQDYSQPLRAPRLPIVDSTQPLEWYPDPEPEPESIKSRNLDATYLDAMMFHPSFTMTQKSNMAYTTPRTRVRPNLWRRYLRARIPPEAQEALIAAAMLYLGEESQCPGILSVPFPTNESPRFPALYLDEEFMERPSIKNSSLSTFNLLRRLKDQIPAELLRELTRKMLDAASGVRVNGYGLRLLKVLAKGDRPELALNMIQEIVLERPDDSSWHRNLLNEGLLCSLPKATVKEFLARLSESLQAKSIEQAQLPNDDGEKSHKPILKVTTVKMLAQLLSGAKFVEDSLVATILIGIFESSRHLDIRVAVVESMLELLTSTGNSKVKDAILSALETHAVPIMSSLNERRPICEDEWHSFEANGFTEMPEVYLESRSDLPPVLEAICNVATSDETEDDVRKALALKVLYPALHGSIKINRRWHQGFLQHLGIPPVDLPPCPVKYRLLSRLLVNHGYCTKEVLDNSYGVFAANYDPSPEIEAVNQKIREDSKLRTSNAGQHWLENWDNSHTRMMSKKGALYTPSVIFKTQPNNKAKFPSVSIADVEEVVLKQADLLLRNSESLWHHWGAFICTLQPDRHRAVQETPWTENCRPVLAAIVEKVEEIRRSPEWRDDPSRTPSILPDTFPQRLSLAMHGPAYEFQDGKPSNEAIVNRLVDLLREMATSKRPYIKHFGQMKDYMKDHSPRRDDFVKVATLLGSPVGGGKGEVTTEEYMRVKLASKMLQLAEAPTDLLVKQAGIEMVRGWSASLDEEIRMAGLKLSKRQAGDYGKRPWYTGET